MSDNDPPFPPCHASPHSAPCRCCSGHRRRILELLAERDAARSTAAKSMALMTERVISDAIQGSTMSSEEFVQMEQDHDDEMYYKILQEQKEHFKKKEDEANTYTIIKVSRDEDLSKQIGKDVYFDLVDHEKVRSFQIQKQLPFIAFKEAVAKEYGIPVQFQRYWFWAKRRPSRPLMDLEELETVGTLEVSKGIGMKLFLEVEFGLDLSLLPPPNRSRDDILIFFKLYEPKKKEIRYVGRMFVKTVGKPLEIFGKLNKLAGFPENEEIVLFEEIRDEPNVMCKPIDKRISFKDSKLEDGGIICFQKAIISEREISYPYPDVPSFLEYVRNRQVVHFRLLKKPKEDNFSLELSKLHTYDDVVERVAHHIGLDNPSKIRLTSHDWISERPNRQPIQYRGLEHLSDMLIDCNKTSDILYYEVLAIPLPQLESLKFLKVIFHHSTKNEAVGYRIALPKHRTVGDVINTLKSKVDLSRPDAELRLLEVFYHKIKQIFSPFEKVENINDQLWTKDNIDQSWYLRAEEIEEEEANLGPQDWLIHVYHFMKDPNQNQQVQNFGEPFLLVIHEGETLAKVKKRIQKKLQVQDQEYAKWKFAFLSTNHTEYLKDSDVISHYFQIQRRDVVPGAGEYLGLEHTDTPKKSLLHTKIDRFLKRGQ